MTTWAQKEVLFQSTMPIRKCATYDDTWPRLTQKRNEKAVTCSFFTFFTQQKTDCKQDACRHT